MWNHNRIYTTQLSNSHDVRTMWQYPIQILFCHILLMIVICYKNMPCFIYITMCLSHFWPCFIKHCSKMFTKYSQGWVISINTGIVVYWLALSNFVDSVVICHDVSMLLSLRVPWDTQQKEKWRGIFKMNAVVLEQYTR